TRADLLAVQEHRAGTTLREATAEPGAVQVELVVQDVQERRIKAGAHSMSEAVDLDLDAVRHSSSSVGDSIAAPATVPRGVGSRVTPLPGQRKSAASVES